MRGVFLDGYFLALLVIACNLQVSGSKCANSVLSKRRELFVPEGGSVSLICKIQHCGVEGWTGGWSFRSQLTFLSPSPRHHLSNYTENANSTCLLVTIQNLNQSDSGIYQCYVIWREGFTSQGHVTFVNVTTADPESGRSLYHRLLVCGVAGLCLPLVLALACCLSSRSPPAPPVPLRLGGSPTVRVKPKAGVVYASLALDRPVHHGGAQSKEEPVVYSTLNFPNVHM